MILHTVRKEKLEKVANFGFECQIGRDFHKNFRSRLFGDRGSNYDD